jgi:hypothetical protein
MILSSEFPQQDTLVPPQADPSALDVPMPWHTRPAGALPTLVAPFPSAAAEKRYHDGIAAIAEGASSGRARVQDSVRSIIDTEPLVPGVESQGGYPALGQDGRATITAGTTNFGPTPPTVRTQDTLHAPTPEAVAQNPARRFTTVRTAFGGLRRVVTGLRQDNGQQRSASQQAVTAYPKPESNTTANIYNNWLQSQGR